MEKRRSAGEILDYTRLYPYRGSHYDRGKTPFLQSRVDVERR